jgi:hypothetical protein
MSSPTEGAFAAVLHGVRRPADYHRISLTLALMRRRGVMPGRATAVALHRTIAHVGGVDDDVDDNGNNDDADGADDAVDADDNDDAAAADDVDDDGDDDTKTRIRAAVADVVGGGVDRAINALSIDALSDGDAGDIEITDLHE